MHVLGGLRRKFGSGLADIVSSARRPRGANDHIFSFLTGAAILRHSSGSTLDARSGHLAATSLQIEKLLEVFVRISGPALRHLCGCCLNVAVWISAVMEKKQQRHKSSPYLLDARSRSVLRGCAILRGNKKVPSHLKLFNSPVSVFNRHTFQDANTSDQF